MYHILQDCNGFLQMRYLQCNSPSHNICCTEVILSMYSYIIDQQITDKTKLLSANVHIKSPSYINVNLVTAFQDNDIAPVYHQATDPWFPYSCPAVLHLQRPHHALLRVPGSVHEVFLPPPHLVLPPTGESPGIVVQAGFPRNLFIFPDFLYFFLGFKKNENI